MTNAYQLDEPFDDVEAMVRAAGQYVRASEDLRPRVLEAARLQCGEQRAQRCLRRAALFVALLALFTVMDQRGLDEDQLVSNRMLMAAGFDDVYSPTAPATMRSGDGDWRMLDALTKLRRQQAQVLRL